MRKEEEEAYLYSIYLGYHGRVHEIYRSKLDGSDSPIHGCPILRLPFNDDFPFNGFAFAAVGSRLYMIAVGDMPHVSTDVFVVETRNIDDNVTNGDIMRRIPSVLHGPTARPNHNIVLDPVLRRQAVSIDGKVYLYSSDFSTFSLSGFEVFDPLTETSTLLPEPPVEMDKCTSCFAALGTKLILCQTDLKSQKPWTWSEPYKPVSNSHKPMFVFDTAHWQGGWREVRDVYNPPWVQNFDTMPLATALGGNNDDGGLLFHATVNPDTRGRFCPSSGTRDHFYHVIVKFDDDPNDLVRIVKWCKIKGVPRELARAPALADGRGCVIFACDSSHFDRSDDNDSIKFKRFSLARQFNPQTMEECYVAELVSSSELHLPHEDQLFLVASFVI